MRKHLLPIIALGILSAAQPCAARIISGDASFDIGKRKLGGVFLFRVNGARLSGSLFVNGIAGRLPVKGSVDGNLFRARIAGRNKISGSLTGRVTTGLFGKGSLRIPGVGRSIARLKSRPFKATPPGYEGYYTAEFIGGVPFEKVTIRVGNSNPLPNGQFQYLHGLEFFDPHVPFFWGHGSTTVTSDNEPLMIASEDPGKLPFNYSFGAEIILSDEGGGRIYYDVVGILSYGIPNQVVHFEGHGIR